MTRTQLVTDVALTKTVNKTDVKLWDEIMYTIKVKNQGGNRASGLIVKDYWPDGLIYTSHDAIGQDREVYNKDTTQWNIGTLEPGQEKELRISGRISAIKNIVNIAEVYAMTEKDIDSTPNNLNPSEDDYGAVTVIPVTQIATDTKGQAKLADTGVATTITFGLGSLLLIAAIALEEMRSKVKLYNYDEDES
ncbi:MAG: DUF11 domain-containing protein [Patescibacteria group bacterium]